MWELFANRSALIDESFASAGKLDGCGLLLLYIQQKQLWEEEQSVLTLAKVLDKVWYCTASNHPVWAL